MADGISSVTATCGSSTASSRPGSGPEPGRTADAAGVAVAVPYDPCADLVVEDPRLQLPLNAIRQTRKVGHPTSQDDDVRIQDVDHRGQPAGHAVRDGRAPPSRPGPRRRPSTRCGGPPMTAPWPPGGHAPARARNRTSRCTPACHNSTAVRDAPDPRATARGCDPIPPRSDSPPPARAHPGRHLLRPRCPRSPRRRSGPRGRRRPPPRRGRSSSRRS